MSSKTKPSSSVNLVEVDRLAQLSRLSFGPREAGKLKGELSSILDYFALLERVDLERATKASEVMAAPFGKRDDVVKPSDADAILRGVPEKKGRYVKAPKVF
jgi:aspartyl/glutamyl-tRNA(Asn/Gln) amidotransferase C subunit